MPQLVHQVGCLPFSPHVVAETIIAKADRDPEPHQSLYICGADGIVHIAAWLVSHPSAGFAQQCFFGGIDVDSVGDNTLRAKNSGIRQAIAQAHEEGMALTGSGAVGQQDGGQLGPGLDAELGVFLGEALVSRGVEQMLV